MLYDKLKKYSKSGIYPFHMPGHKRNFGEELNSLYSIDITEIDGFDNLHSPNGCIKEVEKKAERVYSVKKSFLLVNGSTGGILAAVRAMTNYGDTVAIARNSHKSVYNAIELCGLKPVYIMPRLDCDFGIALSITKSQVKNLLDDNPNIKLVILTSPTYEGVVSDIRGISEICHNKGVKLLVDEAHGAHFPFSSKFPNEAVSSGADVAVTSLHKTLPSLTQTALLLTNNSDLISSLRENLSVFETSSPSYVLMASIDKCLDFLEGHESKFNDYVEKLNIFYKKVKNLKNLKILYNTSFVKKVFDFDIGKIVVSTKNTNLNGNELADILRNEYKIEIEMASADYIIAMTSVCDTNGGFERLSNALLKIDQSCGKAANDIQNTVKEIEAPVTKFYPCEKCRYTKVKSTLSEAVGKASLEYVWAYPPGIPLLVPGEIITKELIRRINFLIDSNVKLYSTDNSLPMCISTAEFD